MLILNRKCGDKIMIGDDITVTVREIHGDYVRLGVEAPEDVRIVREEVRQREPDFDLKAFANDLMRTQFGGHD